MRPDKELGYTKKRKNHDGLHKLMHKTTSSLFSRSFTWCTTRKIEKMMLSSSSTFAQKKYMVMAYRYKAYREICTVASNAKRLCIDRTFFSLHSATRAAALTLQSTTNKCVPSYWGNEIEGNWPDQPRIRNRVRKSRAMQKKHKYILRLSDPQKCDACVYRIAAFLCRLLITGLPFSLSSVLWHNPQSSDFILYDVHVHSVARRSAKCTLSAQFVRTRCR